VAERGTGELQRRRDRPLIACSSPGAARGLGVEVLRQMGGTGGHREATADAHGVTISMDIGQYRAGVRRRAAKYALRVTRHLGAEARDRALAAARNLTVFFPEGRVQAVIRAAAEGDLAR
jgi:hypothetical protein